MAGEGTTGACAPDRTMRGGMVKASDLQPIGRGLSPGRSASRNDLKQVVLTHVPLFTKQYKSIPM